MSIGCGSASDFANKVIPNTDIKLMVLPYNHSVIHESPTRFVRVVTSVNTRKDNAFILNAMAKFNPNINVERWRISSRRPKGAVKSLLFMRMDDKSFEIIKRQDMKLNYTLGPITIELERKKANNGIRPSEAINVAVSGNSFVGKPSSHTLSSHVLMASAPASNVPGLIREDGSDTKRPKNRI